MAGAEFNINVNSDDDSAKPIDPSKVKVSGNIPDITGQAKIPKTRIRLEKNIRDFEFPVREP